MKRSSRRLAAYLVMVALYLLSGDARTFAAQERETKGTPPSVQLNMRVDRGESYVSSQEYAQLLYLGKAYAAGNVWSGNGERVTKAWFVYRRGGEDVSPIVESEATADSGCNWTPGPEKEWWQWDSLDPTEPKTTWHYDFGYSPPEICGLPEDLKNDAL